jgi:hypothetical protein
VKSSTALPMIHETRSFPSRGVCDFAGASGKRRPSEEGEQAAPPAKPMEVNSQGFGYRIQRERPMGSTILTMEKSNKGRRR